MIGEMQANATYTKVITDDGSPTVRVSSADHPNEDMHHSGGALSESLFVYGEIVRAALNFNLPPKVASVGLGLGYNEAISVAEILTFEQKRFEFLEKLLIPKRPEHVFPEVKLLSFEKDETIRRCYQNWLLNKDLDAFWAPLFQDVLILVGKKYDISDGHLKREIGKLYREEKFKIAGAVENFRGVTNERYSIILYDAFSLKATPKIWDEEFLKSFLNGMSGQFCFFSSYAALNGLNRALESCGYQLDIHRGFKNKRNATWAYRCSE